MTVVICKSACTQGSWVVVFTLFVSLFVLCMVNRFVVVSYGCLITAMATKLLFGAGALRVEWV